MKIIKVDSFDREGPGFDPIFICGGITKEHADIVCQQLNDAEWEHSPNFYRVVPDDYVLTKWEP